MESFQLLKKAQQLLGFLDSSDRLQSITYNNLGCFYKTVKKHQLALQMFQRSLELKNNDKAHSAGTYLNISSIFSALNNHKKALEFANLAVDLLKEVYNTDSSIAASLIITLYSTGKEYEQLKDFAQAESVYNQALNLSEEVPFSSMIEKINASLMNLRKRKQFSIKPRYSSTNRQSELPTIKTNHSDYMKQYIIIEDKKKMTPKALRNYPPILDIPYTRVQTVGASPKHKKANTNISEIKKELQEYEEKFRKIIGGKKTMRPRQRKSMIPKILPKNYLYRPSADTPISPPSVDLKTIAIIIQKH